MRIRFLPLTILVVTVVFCMSNKVNAENTLVGIWEFRVDRAWDGSGDPQFPHSLLAESSYHPVSKGRTYRIFISETQEQGLCISIGGILVGDTSLKGCQQEENKFPFISYLDKGTLLFNLGPDFAFGRFVITKGKNGLEGELTQYGSGRPITMSERGMLTR